MSRENDDSGYTTRAEVSVHGPGRTDLDAYLEVAIDPRIVAAIGLLGVATSVVGIVL